MYCQGKVQIFCTFGGCYNERTIFLDTLTRILGTMKEQRVSQQEICQYLNLTKQTFSEWKAGRSESYLKYLPQIAEYLDVSVDYLLGKTPSPEREDIPEDEKRLRELLSQMSEEQLQTALKIISAIAEEK
jgi:transcriptional regulator with XRE-family HTH domain